jgi:hypothetical protein
MAGRRAAPARRECSHMQAFKERRPPRVASPIVSWQLCHMSTRPQKKHDTRLQKKKRVSPVVALDNISQDCAPGGEKLTNR